MVRAIVLMNVRSNRSETILKELRQIKEIKEAYAVYGHYDFLAIIETKSIEGLKDFIHSDLQKKVPDLYSTQTLIVIH